jgi:diguanylate cyclase (GGDEF)-like protein
MPAVVRAPGSLLRTCFIIAGYIILWIAADVGARNYVASPGFSPWYLGAALDLALFYALGARFWPLVVVADLIDLHFFPQGPHVGFWTIFAHGIITGLGYAGMYLVLTGWFKVWFSTRTARDAIIFAVSAVVGPAIVGLAVTPVLVASDVFPASAFWEQWGRFVVGDGIGILAAFPPLALLLERLHGNFSKFDPRIDWREFALAVFTTIATVWIAYTLLSPKDLGAPLLALPFLPLAWLAIRAGVVGASIGILCADITATVLHRGLHFPPNTLADYQAFIATSAAMTLVLGAISCERNRLVRQLRKRAETDELTGLANRARLREWLLARGATPVALIVADIDHMHLLNEGIGRDDADSILRRFSLRLRELAGPSEIVARVGSDEFVLASENVDRIEGLASAVQAIVAQPFVVEDARLYLSISVGIAVGAGARPDILLHAADVAIDRAKASYLPQTIHTGDANLARGQTLLADLHRAAEAGEIRPFFQPIYRIDPAGHWGLVGAEALIRWGHPLRGLLLPASFLDLLERLALSERVGWALFEESFKWTKLWRTRDPAFRIWLNIFSRQLRDPRLIERLQEGLLRYHLPPGALVIEINERTVAADETQIATIAQSLRAAGIGVAIDDFGTGGSSLGRLREVPCDILKIDHSFVARCEVDPRARAVIAAVARLARDIDLEVLAEGVENAMQITVVENLGCEMIQGYALAHPMPGERIDEYLGNRAD